MQYAWSMCFKHGWRRQPKIGKDRCSLTRVCPRPTTPDNRLHLYQRNTRVNTGGRQRPPSVSGHVGDVGSCVSVLTATKRRTAVYLRLQNDRFCCRQAGQQRCDQPNMSASFWQHITYAEHASKPTVHRPWRRPSHVLDWHIDTVRLIFDYNTALVSYI